MTREKQIDDTKNKFILHDKIEQEEVKAPVLIEAALDASKDGILVLDTRGKLVKVNKQFIKLWKIPAIFLAGYDEKKLLEYIVSQLENPDSFVSKVESLFVDPKAESFDILYFKDQRIFECTSLPMFISSKPIGRVWTFADVTNRYRAEEEILKLNKVVEQSPATIVITDLDGNIEYVNPKFCQLTGYTALEALGQNPRILKGEETPDEMYKDLWETITSGNEWRGEFHNKKKNGELFWEDATISPILDDNERIVNFLAVKEDITERKIFEYNLKKKIDEIARMNKLMTGREMRIIEMKKEVNKLLKELGREEKYGSVK